MKKLAILTIATGAYFDTFFDDFQRSIFKTFAPDQAVEIFCFTDSAAKAAPNVHLMPATSIGWPFDTLLRFHLIHTIADQLTGFDSCIYMDSDMIAVQPMPQRLWNVPLFAVEHPSFRGPFAKPTFEIDKWASSFAPWAKRRTYAQGCFWGGQTPAFLNLIMELAEKVDEDLQHGDIPVWHDESYLNWYLARHAFRRLSPAFAYPEKSKLWLKPIVIHRAKAHGAIRKLPQTGLTAHALLAGPSDAERIAFYNLLYLRAHDKTQRLEKRLIGFGRWVRPLSMLARAIIARVRG